jgi:hypothetical protein
MGHAILGTIMLLCAVLTTLFTANALEQFGQSRADQRVPVDQVHVETVNARPTR